jgi:hypothetical protein
MASLDDGDLSARLSKKEGKPRLKAAQKRLLELRLQVGGQLGDVSLDRPCASSLRAGMPLVRAARSSGSSRSSTRGM